MKNEVFMLLSLLLPMIAGIVAVKFPKEKLNLFGMIMGSVCLVTTGLTFFVKDSVRLFSVGNISLAFRVDIMEFYLAIMVAIVVFASGLFLLQMKKERAGIVYTGMFLAEAFALGSFYAENDSTLLLMSLGLFVAGYFMITAHLESMKEKLVVIVGEVFAFLTMALYVLQLNKMTNLVAFSSSGLIETAEGADVRKMAILFIAMIVCMVVFFVAMTIAFIKKADYVTMGVAYTVMGLAVNNFLLRQIYYVLGLSFLRYTPWHYATWMVALVALLLAAVCVLVVKQYGAKLSLIGLMGLISMMYALVTMNGYGFLGAFFAMAAVAFGYTLFCFATEAMEVTTGSLELSAFAGVGKKNAWMVGFLLIALLTMIGAPATVGFSKLLYMFIGVITINIKALKYVGVAVCAFSLMVPGITMIQYIENAFFADGFKGNGEKSVKASAMAAMMVMLVTGVAFGIYNLPVLSKLMSLVNSFS